MNPHPRRTITKKRMNPRRRRIITKKMNPLPHRNTTKIRRVTPNRNPPPADRPMSRPKGNPPEPLKIQLNPSFFQSGLSDKKHEKTQNSGKYYVCEKCSKVFNDDNWSEWPEGGCCNNKVLKKVRKPNGIRGLDSESDEETQNAGECFYINSIKTGCPRRNSCGYIRRYGISTISAKARHWPTNAPFEKPQKDPEDVHNAKLVARRWGNEYVSGDVEQVSEIPPTKKGPKKIILEYVGDESRTIRYQPLKWGAKQYITVDVEKLKRKIYLDPFKTADLAYSLKDSFWQEAIIRAPHRIINSLAECKVKENGNQRTTIQSIVVCPKELRELFQELACMTMSNVQLGKETLFRFKNEMYQLNFSVRNALLIEKPSKEAQKNDEQNWKNDEQNWKGHDKHPAPPRNNHENYWNESQWGWGTENLHEEKRAKSVSSEWDRKSYRSNNSRRTEKVWVPKNEVSERRSVKSERSVAQTVRNQGEERDEQNGPQPTHGAPRQKIVNQEVEIGAIGNKKTRSRTKWVIVAYQEKNETTGQIFPEIWYCQKDPNPEPNLQHAYWSRVRTEGYKERSCFLKPDKRTWANYWMVVSTTLLGRVDDQKFTGHHQRYGPFSEEELDITELNNEAYESIRDGPMSEMSPREIINREDEDDENEDDDKETPSQVSSFEMPAEQEIDLIEYEISDSDEPEVKEMKRQLKKENEETRVRYNDERKKKFEEKRDKTLGPSIKQIELNKRHISETQMRAQAVENDNAKTLAKIRDSIKEDEKERKKKEMIKKLKDAKERNMNKMIEIEQEDENKMRLEMEEKKEKLGKVYEKVKKKLSDSETELSQLTQQSIVLQKDLPGVKEENEEGEGMIVDDDRRRKRGNETKDEKVEPRRKKSMSSSEYSATDLSDDEADVRGSAKERRKNSKRSREKRGKRERRDESEKESSDTPKSEVGESERVAWRNKWASWGELVRDRIREWKREERERVRKRERVGKCR